MGHKRLQELMLVALGFVLLMGCGPIEEAQIAAQAAGPQAWIDAPLGGSTFNIGTDVEIVAHGSDGEGVQKVEIGVNGDVLVGIPANSTDQTLITARHRWQPPGPGSYTIQAQTQNRDGAWSDYAQVVIIIGETEESPPTSLPTEDAAPSATAVQTTVTVMPTPTPTLTATPTPTPCTLSAPIPTQPDDGTTVSETRPSLQWGYRGTCPPDAYRIELTTDQTFATITQSGGAPAGSASWAPAADLIDCTAYYWRVAGIDDSTPGPYSDPRTFTTDFTDSCNGPIIIGPPVIIDTEPPTVTLTYDPLTPNEDQNIVFTATAGDNVGMVRIEIIITRSGESSSGPAHTCRNVTTCTYQGGPYEAGVYIIQAKAYDAAGNEGATWPEQVRVWEVVR